MHRHMPGRGPGESEERRRPLVEAEPLTSGPPPPRAAGSGAAPAGGAVQNAAELAHLVERMLRAIGEDPDREGLSRTPDRVARSLAYLTRGYEQDPYEVLGHAVFNESYDEMVLVKDIDVFSLCEHHLLPFFGRCHVAYIPARKIAGLSKIARLVDVYARRLQIQERLTRQIGGCIQDVLAPEGVGVVIQAYHMCMMMRGIEKQNSIAITSCMLGSFRDDSKVRMEFLELIRSPRPIG